MLREEGMMDPEFDTGDDENAEVEKPEDRAESQKRMLHIECIKLIQRNELGRQGRNRFKHNYEQNKKLKQHLQNSTLDKDDFVTSVQKGFRAMLGRERVKDMRESEFEFLGMKRVTSAEDLFEEQLRRENRSQRKLLQKEYHREMTESKLRLSTDLRITYSEKKEVELYDEIWDKICAFKDPSMNNKEFTGPNPLSSSEWPPGAKLEDVLNPPEPDEDGGDPKKKGKDKKEPKKKKGKKKGKKGKSSVLMEGCGKSTDDFLKCLNDFKDWEDWETDVKCLPNPEQRVDEKMLEKDLLAQVENDVTKKVHKQIMEELDALAAGAKIKGQKKKKKKGKKKGGGKDADEDEETALEKKIQTRDKKKFKLGKKDPKTRRDNFAELVRYRLIRKIEPVELSDLVSGFDYIAHDNILATLNPEVGLYEPSMHQIKNYVTTQLIIPLACPAVASRLAAVDKKSVIKSCVFFGPSGTGK